MENIYMKFREELTDGTILHPNSPTLEETIQEAKRPGYEGNDIRLWGNGILRADNDGEYFTAGYSGKELIEFGYTEHTITPQYRYVYVSDESVEDALEDKDKRILIDELPGKVCEKYICVAGWYEEEFRKGEWCSTIPYSYIAEIPTEESPKEMTIAEIEKELGYSLKIIK